MNSEKLLAAMSGIDSRYITEAQDALGYRTGDKKRASHKTIWRTLLIAAVISALRSRRGLRLVRHKQPEDRHAQGHRAHRDLSSGFCRFPGKHGHQ